MNYKHGHGKKGEKSLTFASWMAMKRRCDYSYTSGYKHYGGKGIGYDLGWKQFEKFLADMGERPSEDFDLSRVDHSKDYSKDNCLWSPVAVNRSTRPKVIREKRVPKHPKGVYLVKSGRYRVKIRVGGYTAHLGTFDTALEAATAREKFIINYTGITPGISSKTLETRTGPVAQLVRAEDS